MNNNTLEDLFEELNDSFNQLEPHEGHQQRFLDKLQKNNSGKTISINSKRVYSFWKPILGIAASIALVVTLFTTNTNNDNTEKDLASISPEMADTQDFFTLTIAEELNKLKKENSPETQRLITDALEQIKILENDYQTLKSDLNESGNDKRVIYAMISNFQNRIDILQNTLQQIETVKQLKNNYNEDSTTI